MASLKTYDPQLEKGPDARPELLSPQILLTGREKVDLYGSVEEPRKQNRPNETSRDAGTGSKSSDYVDSTGQPNATGDDYVFRLCSCSSYIEAMKHVCDRSN